MQMTPATPSSIDRALVRQRAISFVLVVIIHVLGFLLLLSLSPETLKRITPEIKSFPLLSFSERPAPKVAATSAAAKRKVVVERPNTPIIPTKSQLPSNIIWMTSDEFKASDIRDFRAQHADSGAGDGSSADANAKGNGEGPGGERLYPADWYREPTDAEMAFYMKGKNQSGWGMIACRTIADYRVEDCRELGESPQGSGFARALRQAAWQFKVRPPRIGGKPQIGTWVRIVYDLKVGVVKSAP